MSKNYVVATTKSWNIDNFKRFSDGYDGEWHLVTKPSELTVEYLANLKPEYVFFPHWSWIVPKNIVEAYDCICFHMTDLPFGRGGSPLQNLISKGVEVTKLSVIKMSSAIDEGPVYFKLDLTLDGTAEDILKRASILSFSSMARFVQEDIAPQEQVGDPVYFERRKPEQSNIEELSGVCDLYNHIRMLDGEGYPPAFLNTKYFKMKFSDAKLTDGRLVASVAFIENCDENQ